MNDLQKNDIKSFLDAIDHRMPNQDSSLSGIFDQLSPQVPREDSLLIPKQQITTSAEKIESKEQA